MGVAIKVEELSKAYRLGQLNTGSLSQDIERSIRLLIGKDDPFLKIGETNDRSKAGNSNIVWSLKDIDFSVNQGQTLGIIGKNGAGKSTLLKVLSNVTTPTSGKVKIKGRVASLLEVGTGFHPELTGRENVFLNGAILGMTRSEIKSQFDEIVSFSGVERYIDTPVKRYSSGMRVRLGFAVAAHLRSEILIVDEVLAVGDAEFQEKCMGKMGDISKNNGKTILFVSHNMSSIRKLCEQTLILDKGRLFHNGNTGEAIDFYLGGKHMQNSIPSVISDEIISQNIEGVYNKQNPIIVVEEISILNQEMKPCVDFQSTEQVLVKINFKLRFNAADFRIVISIVNEDNVAILRTQLSDSDIHQNALKKGSYEAVCAFPENLFASNTYKLTFQIIDINKEDILLNGLAKFSVKYDNQKYLFAPFDNCYFRPLFNWELNKREQ